MTCRQMMLLSYMIQNMRYTQRGYMNDEGKSDISIS